MKNRNVIFEIKEIKDQYFIGFLLEIELLRLHAQRWVPNAKAFSFVASTRIIKKLDKKIILDVKDKQTCVKNTLVNTCL